MFACPDVGLVWCINAKVLLHITFAIPNANALTDSTGTMTFLKLFDLAIAKAQSPFPVTHFDQ